MKEFLLALVGLLAGAAVAGEYVRPDIAYVDGCETIVENPGRGLAPGGWNTMTPQAKDVLERYVRQGGTLVMSRPQLTTRIDRDYVTYTDRDLLPLFGFLPPEGKPGDFVEKTFGKGRYILFTAHDFPAANAAAKKAYGETIAKLARAVKQTVTIEADAETLTCITYAVYPHTIYFLNVDTRHERTFTWVKNGVRKSLTLKPCEIKEFER